MGDRFAKGLALRKEVLGADYVERALAGADAFSMPMQQLTTEYCWGEIWSRPGLSRRDRSLLNLGMISALNRPHELKLHVKAALRNGLTREEIGEALLQGLVLCGRCGRRMYTSLPHANTPVYECLRTAYGEGPCWSTVAHRIDDKVVELFLQVMAPPDCE